MALRRRRSRAGMDITSAFSRCSPTSLVFAGLAVDAEVVLSEAAETHAAGPPSGASAVVLKRMAHIRLLCACSVAGVARTKLSVSSPNSLADNSARTKRVRASW